MKLGNTYFEPHLISNFDNDGVISNNTNEYYSNFRFLGIGKPSKKQLERKEKRQEKKKINKEERKNLSLGKRILNVYQKFNPAAAVPRSSALVGIRFNVFGIATKLYPALISEQELKKKNFDLNKAKKAKNAWQKVKSIWISIGGATSSLEKAIKDGHNKPIFKTKKAKKRLEKENSNFDGLYELEYSEYAGEAALTYISLGLTVLGVISKLISDSGASNNPYVDGSDEYNKFQSELNENSPQELTDKQKEEFKEIQDAANKDVESGMGLDDTTADEIERNANKNNSEEDKILGMSKTTFWIVTGVITASVFGLIFWKIKNK